DRGAVREYFGDLAAYCDPGDVVSLRDTILRVYEATPDAGRRAALRAHAAQHTSSAAARATLKAYAAARANVAQRTSATRPTPTITNGVATRTNATPTAAAAPAAPTPAAAPATRPLTNGNGTPATSRKLEIGSGTDPQPGYEHLDSRPELP